MDLFISKLWFPFVKAMDLLQVTPYQDWIRIFDQERSAEHLRIIALSPATDGRTVPSCLLEKLSAVAVAGRKWWVKPPSQTHAINY